MLLPCFFISAEFWTQMMEMAALTNISFALDSQVLFSLRADKCF